MVVIRRRLIFWLIRAYIKKAGKTIIFSFLLGLIIFFVILFGSQYVKNIIPVYNKTSIGIIGAYRQENLPPVILEKLSRGLTVVGKDGSISPDMASSWKETDQGRTYIFYLKKNLYFNNGKNVTSDAITYNFSDVRIERPDKYTIIFKLKEAYAPFLVTVSKPVFAKGFIGVKDYKVEDIKLNGNFVQSITMASKKNRFEMISYKFYPSEEALKMAFILGEITQASGITAPVVKDTAFDKFPNAKVIQRSNNSRLVTLFYNTADRSLSDRKLRIALSYALPDTFPQGKKSFLPYSTESSYYNYNKDVIDRDQDFSRAKIFLQPSETASQSAQIPDKLILKTLAQYRATADEIAKAWQQIGIKTDIEVVEGVPDQFQIFLGDFTIPKDPDQYILWHSGQEKNITQYKNLRIDKLLEDGRKTTNYDVRKKIYGDFQKHLFEEAPANFLYFPYEYDIVRK